MSTDYRPSKNVRASELLDGRLESFGVRQKMIDETSAKQKCLTDGNNFLWVHINDEGFVSTLTRYFPNGAPAKILRAICEALDTDVFSEHEPEFWGFDTQEEWDAWQDAISKKHDDEFYADLVKFVYDEPNGISPGTVGECQAQIAKRLVGDDPTLISPERRVEFIEKINSIYDRDQAVHVTLSEEDIALARMVATHEDDLPQA